MQVAVAPDSFEPSLKEQTRFKPKILVKLMLGKKNKLRLNSITFNHSKILFI